MSKRFEPIHVPKMEREYEDEPESANQSSRKVDRNKNSDYTIDETVNHDQSMIIDRIQEITANITLKIDEDQIIKNQEERSLELETTAQQVQAGDYEF